LSVPRNNILELHHARIGEEQRGIPARHKRRRWHSRVSMLDEEVNEGLADFRTGQFFHSFSTG